MAAKEKRGLGIGLDALFGPDLQTEPDEIRTLPLSQVEPRQDQPRESFDEERLQDLAASISRHGLIQPVIVRRLEKFRSGSCRRTTAVSRSLRWWRICSGKT